MIASTIETLIGDLELVKKLGRNGRLFVERNFERHLIWRRLKNCIYNKDRSPQIGYGYIRFLCMLLT